MTIRLQGFLHLSLLDPVPLDVFFLFARAPFFIHRTPRFKIKEFNEGSNDLEEMKFGRLNWNDKMECITKSQFSESPFSACV